jgi:hypothetical protein
MNPFDLAITLRPLETARIEFRIKEAPRERMPFALALPRNRIMGVEHDCPAAG